MNAPSVAPADRVVLAGPAAIVTALDAFAGKPNLDAADQCLLLADGPGERQLFGLFLLFCLGSAGSRAKPRFLTPELATGDLGRIDAVWIDDQTSEPCKRAACALGESLR